MQDEHTLALKHPQLTPLDTVALQASTQVERPLELLRGKKLLHVTGQDIQASMQVAVLAEGGG